MGNQRFPIAQMKWARLRLRAHFGFGRAGCGPGSIPTSLTGTTCEP
jgi:hypothetical protein